MISVILLHLLKQKLLYNKISSLKIKTSSASVLDFFSLTLYRLYLSVYQSVVLLAINKIPFKSKHDAFLFSIHFSQKFSRITTSCFSRKTYHLLQKMSLMSSTPILFKHFLFYQVKYLFELKVTIDFNHLCLI